VDETGTHVALTPLYAWAPKGQRARGQVPRNRGTITTLIAALSLDRSGGGVGDEQRCAWLVPACRVSPSRPIPLRTAVILQLELGCIGSQPPLVMTDLRHGLMMPPKERPGEGVSGSDHLLPEQLPDQAEYLWYGVGDHPTANPLRDLKGCKLLGPGFGSQAFFSCSAFA
jgi:hypothetical protein